MLPPTTLLLGSTGMFHTYLTVSYIMSLLQGSEISTYIYTSSRSLHKHTRQDVGAQSAYKNIH
jgi:hypothetical protein